MLGSSAQRPATINDYTRGIDFGWIELGRTDLLARLPGRKLPTAPVGLVVRHVLDAYCEGLRANEHAIGYSLRGAVRSYFHDCLAFRSLARAPSGRDVFIGFDFDGRSPPIATGANASLYLIDCNASIGSSPRLANSIGCRLLGALSDTFIIRFETTSLDVGIEVDGQAAQMSAQQRAIAHLDLNIETPVLDQCRRYRASAHRPVGAGHGFGPIALCRAFRRGEIALEISNSGGSIGIEGGQLIGTFAPGAVGIRVDRVSGAAFAGTSILGFTRPVRATAARAFELWFPSIRAGRRSNEPAVDSTIARPATSGPALPGPRTLMV